MRRLRVLAALTFCLLQLDDAGNCSASRPCRLDADADVVDDEEADLMKVTLLQTSLKVGGRMTALHQVVTSRDPVDSHDEPEEEVQAALAASTFLQTDLEVQAAAAEESSRISPRSFRQTDRCGMLDASGLPGLAPLHFEVGMATLRAAGEFPPQRPCQESHELGQPQRSNGDFATRLFQAKSKLLTSERVQEYYIIAAYVFAYALSIACIMYYMANPPSELYKAVEYTAPRCKRVSDIDVEEQTWRDSWFSWLAVSWASPWVAKWGQDTDSQPASLTKIKASALPQMGGKELQARESAELFEKLWTEEVKNVGEQRANLGKVIMKLYTVKTMLYLMLISGLQITISQVYSVFLIQQALEYFHWLQAFHREQGYMPDLRVPLLSAIVVFSVLPFSTIILSSINNSIACRLDQRLCGGLSIALFRKAQRLPCTKLQEAQQQEGHDEEVHKASGGAIVMPQADLMTLINYDVNTNLQGCYQQLCTCVNACISLCVLMVLLWSRLRLATLCAAAVAVPVIFFSLATKACLSHAMFKLEDCMDRRIATLREVLFGIRVVKCYAWEEAMEEKVGNLRREEVKCLASFFRILGIFVGLMLTFPRLLVLSGIWGYSAIYGHHNVANIFTVMQILASLTGTCDLLTKSMARTAVIQPSIQRIEKFLKSAEAPVLLPEKTPDWVDLWLCRHEDIDPEEPVLTRGACPTSTLRVKGSFKWHEEGEAALHNLDLEVKRGEMVAVVGSVGSGKSTLLKAILGELYPEIEEEANISRPEVVAYCSQVPHIAEGSLKDNILFGQARNDERYDEALRAASLTGDLNRIPADDAQIGTRGITLSGGQKARVALARAAYHQGSELALIDDPFGAVDAPTAMVLLDKLLLGSLMRERTRIVVLQPDAERISKFDRVVVMHEGRIVEQGTPDEVMQSEAYKSLLQSSTTEGFSAVDAPSSMASEEERVAPVRRKEDGQAAPKNLREEEVEGRPTWEMIKHYCRVGKWRNILNTCLIFFVQIYVYLLCDLVLARWTNSMSLDPAVSDKSYLLGYLFWLGLGTALWVVCWTYGEWFTLRISSYIHGQALHRILRAPIDKFFDVHPVGRMMNRLGQDLYQVDLYLFMRSTGTIAIVYSTLIPLSYIHTILPVGVSLLAVPLYYLIWTCCIRYWNTTVPLRYCMSNARSDINSLVADVITNNMVIRAYKDQERITLEMGDAIDNSLKAGLLGDRVLRRWLVNRIIFMWSFYTTGTYMVGLLNAASIGAGTLGLCLTNLLLLESLIEPNLDAATGAQFEFIALARIHEYLRPERGIPQEKEMRLKGDARYRSFTVHLPQKGLGHLECSTTEGGAVEVLRNGKVLLQSTADGTALMPASECIGGKGAAAQLQDLCVCSGELAEAESWHRIVSVNHAARDARAMAEELCRRKASEEEGDIEEEVVVGVQSGWLFEGARVKIENIKAGYAERQDVLKGIYLTFEAKTKVGIVGTTGCGKSSLLLVLLRVLEPRHGRVTINGVDTKNIGLATLRSSMGLVPQDPVLFSGTVRHNMDPFGQYTDGRILQALHIAGIADMVEAWPEKLDHQISDEGNNISFGQRQLVCLARMVLRQPALLLLDEATSAIDPHTQEKVQETINSAFPGSTLVAVAHRLETILDFDQVVVLDKGSVAEQGPVKEVAERKDGLFRKMLAAKHVW
eukprot:TRINITY_DN6955_c0_g1_i1.p1 TRINITY_DN6955_c0_g1~~TRINITY_DN6955_c0_g1_i1.p1  ORF type:complete len:1671 (-),score=374.71 TRINITY_DN6955_c0_g1_i1:75-5087(-)